MMDNNVNASKFKRFFKNKNTVTAIAGIAIVAVLLVAYYIRVNQATQPKKIPVANVTIQPKTKITADMIKYINVPQVALEGQFYSEANLIVGKYSNFNTVIPAGSLFYKESVTTKDELPDSALFDVPKGETLYYLTVNMLTSYTNSILPGNYIDIYLSTKENGKALVGKLLTNVKILAVKTSDGKNVFENSEEQRIPYVVIFSLPEEQHLLLRNVGAINSYSVYNASAGSSRMDIIPVPTTANYDGTGENITSNVSSQYLKDYIMEMVSEVPEDVPMISDNTQVVEDDE